jgi:serine phosphatase RsbU (regulator of sigma subunit)
MQLSIRIKMIGILALATVLPVIAAIVTLQTVGYNQRVREKGVSYENEAMLVAGNLALVAHQQIGTLRDLLQLGRMALALESVNQDLGRFTPAEQSNQIARIEAVWTNLPPDHPWVQTFLTNNLAVTLRQFQLRHPWFAELFVTDRAGRLIASTAKTSDYLQSDERWWHRAAAVASGEAWLEGLDFDESARVFSLEVAMPVRRTGQTTGPPQGVLKAVLNAAPLLSTIPLVHSDASAIREVVYVDGRILLRLLDESFQPRSESIPPETARRLNTAGSGWLLARLRQDRVHMIGHAPLRLVGVAGGDTRVRGSSLLQVIVHQEASAVLAPIRRQVLLLGGLGIVGVLACGLAGLYIAQIKLVSPLETLRAAAHAVAGTVREDSSAKAAPPAQPIASSSSQLLDRLDHIRTGDEIEALARDFRGMAAKVLRYQEHLQEEIAAKTEEIRRDLDMAREFQEALLPNRYPEVPSPPSEDGISLQFCHLYRPTLTVSGDFFDIIKLSDHRAGLLIADVMGHGTRSALVTAIIRTLVQEMARNAESPAQLLERVNEHFHTVVGQTRQTVFVSAFYLVADTERATLEFASAGHPSPMVLRRREGRVEPLFGHLSRNPALGLFPKATYSSFQRPLHDDDVFLLFTDGLQEAPSPDESEEFGVERLCSVLRSAQDLRLPELIQSVIDAVDEFAGNQPLPDDICIVGMEVLTRSRTLEPHFQQDEFRAR